MGKLPPAINGHTDRHAADYGVVFEDTQRIDRPNDDEDLRTFGDKELGKNEPSTSPRKRLIGSTARKAIDKRIHDNSDPWGTDMGGI